MMGTTKYVIDGSLIPYYSMCKKCGRFKVLWTRHDSIQLGECQHNAKWEKHIHLNHLK